MEIDEYAYTKTNHPRKQGKYYFTYAYYNNISSPALFYQYKLDDEMTMLVDPNFISMKDVINIKKYAVSANSKYLAFQFDRNGSDWAEIKIVSISSHKYLKDHLTGIKFSSIQWRGNGFYYNKANQNKEFGKVFESGVFYHKLGTDQSEDETVFSRKDSKIRRYSYLTTTNERFLVLKVINLSDNRTNIFFIDFHAEEPHLQPLLLNTKPNIQIIESCKGKFIAKYIDDLSTGKVIEIDPQNPHKWRSIIPEFSNAVLQNVIPFEDRIVVIYQSNLQPIIAVYDYAGKQLYAEFQRYGSSVRGFQGNFYDKDFLYSFTSYTFPSIVYMFNIETFKKELTKETTINFEFNKIKHEQVEYYSKDSVKVSMFLVYHKDLVRDGTNPCLLNAYGGFGAIASPSFDPGIIYFLEKGGVFAFANIRGGGDKGLDWAADGRGFNKQKSFDDFIAAAEYLIDSKYTSNKKLAITGASNGGLVVSVAAMQRPDLFRAVVAEVAPCDMIRFEKFTVGMYHIGEYGTVRDSLSFLNLKSYSPYHHISDTINYPAMLITTGLNDDRVPPFHSFKYVAALQSRTCQTNPIILKVNYKAGHQGKSNLFGVIREEADMYGFILNELSKKDKK